MEKARRIESMGYSTIFMPDHFEDQLAPVPALMAAADATTTLRVGSLVFDNDYKHPLVLAKEAATIDVLSGGRLELGLGAGWMKTDYEQSGIPFDSPGTRIERMAEGIAIIKGLFAPGPLTFEGKHYSVTGHEGTPKPAQRPHPPFLIGGGGRKVLTIAGREADIVGINFTMHGGFVGPEAVVTGTSDATKEKIGWVREGAGDRFDDIELNVTVFVAMLNDDRDAMAGMLAGGFNMSPEQVLASPHAAIGTVDQICDALERRREEFGFSYIVFSGGSEEAMAPVVARLAGT
ncbi:MAG: hypothetical protein QOG64_3267 [Acidimicrobiaceae bacterium]|nr:hypothetical protein [Acidimicrobiaceae bacterium]